MTRVTRYDLVRSVERVVGQLVVEHEVIQSDNVCIATQMVRVAGVARLIQ